MRFEVETLDDALLKLYQHLLDRPCSYEASRGKFSEALATSVLIRRPRARLSRSETRGRAFSSLGELLWYLTRDNKLAFIEPYIRRYRDESEDGVTVYGGYGPRLFSQRSHDQVRNVIERLRLHATSRRAAIQIFNAEDIAAEHAEIPCTMALQFFVRDERLHMLSMMRSNDAYLGLPHDVFCFTMLQEIVASDLGLDVGHYHHFAGSMHLYDTDRELASQFVSERYQDIIEMPAMPPGNPWPALDHVLEAEAKIRQDIFRDEETANIDPYWADLIRLLQIHWTRERGRIEQLRDSMSCPRYRPYITARLAPREEGNG